jgi:hypothetical protein
MSITSLGIVGGMAASPLSQRAAEADRAERDSSAAARQAHGNELAEQAAGIGQTEEDAKAGERDADGRRPWELAPREAAPAAAGDVTADQVLGRAKDPRKEAGQQLDLLG